MSKSRALQPPPSVLHPPLTTCTLSNIHMPRAMALVHQRHLYPSSDGLRKSTFSTTCFPTYHVICEWQQNGQKPELVTELALANNLLQFLLVSNTKYTPVLLLYIRHFLHQHKIEDGTIKGTSQQTRIPQIVNSLCCKCLRENSLRKINFLES